MASAKAIVVYDSTGKPIPNCIAVLNGIVSPLTNAQGYALFPSQFNAAPTYLNVFADGYATYIKALTLTNANENLVVGGTAVTPGNTNLPPLVSFRLPSRDQIVNVKANFCNLFDNDGIPIFDAFIGSLLMSGNTAKAEDWISRLKAAGSTHMTINLSGNYNENLGWAPTYPIPGYDFTNDLSSFASILKYIQSKNLIPIVKLAFDGQAYDSVGWTYGWQWGIDNLQRIANGLSSFINYVLWSTGWDGCFPNWTPQQTVTMLRLMRSVLGDSACISTEFGGPGSVGYIHMGNGAADWSDNQLGLLDNFEIEVNTYPPNVTGIQQVASRLLGANATNIDPSNAGPYYLANTSKKVNICLFEDCAYQISRKQISSADAITVAQTCAQYGFRSFGNGQPL